MLWIILWIAIWLLCGYIGSKIIHKICQQYDNTSMDNAKQVYIVMTIFGITTLMVAIASHIMLRGSNDRVY